MNGVLTITLADGSTVTGMVTGDTRIECVAPQSNTGDDDQGQGDDDQGDQGADSMRPHDQGPGGGDQGQGDDQSRGDRGQGDDDQNENQPCTIMVGDMVQSADLSIDSTGTATWDSVELIVAPTTPTTLPTVPDTDNDGA
jgi:hypothetical protein